MASHSLKPIPIVVDYQRERHEASESREENPDPVHEASGLLVLSVWVLSAAMFLTAFYVASEAPLTEETPSAPVARTTESRSGLAMTQGRAIRGAASLARVRTETRR